MDGARIVWDGVAVATADAVAAILDYVPPPPATLNCAPAAGETMTNTISHLGGFADTTNTGVAPEDEAGLPRAPSVVTSGTGWAWDSRGWIQVNGNNAMLDGLYITANVNVQDATNVTIQNCVIELGGDSWGISLRNADNVHILNNTIRGLEQLGPLRLDNAIRDINSGTGNSDPVEIRGNHVYWASTAVNHITGGGLIEGNYFHDMGFNTVTGLDHTNGIQTEGSNGSLLTIRHNTILIDRSQTDAVMLSGYENDQDNRVVDHNLLAGGGYTLYGRGSIDENATRMTVTNNSFSRMYYPDSGDFGSNVYWDFDASNTWSNNIWDDTGATVVPAT